MCQACKKNMKKCRLLIYLIFFISTQVYSKNSEHSGPSFNCDKSTGDDIEKIICSDKELRKLDLTLYRIHEKARVIDPAVHQKYLQWFEQRTTCKGEDQQACLKTSYLNLIETLNLTIERGLKLPAEWENFTTANWRYVFYGLCYLDPDMDYSKVFKRIKINKTDALLAFTCDSGEYQKSQQVYLLRKYNDGDYLKQIMLFRPFFKGMWKVSLTNEIIGDIEINNSGKIFTVAVQFNESWSCGYIATYNISDLYQPELLRPVSLKGEDECRKKQGVNQWPDISLPLPSGVDEKNNEW